MELIPPELIPADSLFLNIPIPFVLAGILSLVFFDLFRVLNALRWRLHYRKHYGKATSITPPVIIPDKSILLAGDSLITERPGLGNTAYEELSREGYSISLRVNDPLLTKDLLHILSEELKQGRKRYHFVIINIGQNDLVLKPLSVFTTQWWEQLRRVFEIANELGRHTLFVYGWGLVPLAPALPWLYRNAVIRPCVYFALFFLSGEKANYKNIRFISLPNHLEICSDGTHIAPEAHKYVSWRILQAMQEYHWKK